jgi:leader peptidase (prepilin peptidase)/N-methyltransferase
MDLLRIGLAALAALPAGWFAAVLVDRIPDAEPLFDPRPGVPFAIEGSRGRSVAVVVVTVVLFVLGAARFEPIALLVPYLFLFAVLTALSFIDLDTLRLPDRLVFPSLAVSLVMLPLAAAYLDNLSSLRYAALGSFAYFAFLFVAHLIYPPGMGFGDVKLSLMMGMYLGWLAGSVTDTIVLLLYAMLVGFLLGSVAGIAVFIVRRRSRGYPFGPFLAVGTITAILLSEGILTR